MTRCQNPNTHRGAVHVAASRSVPWVRALLLDCPRCVLCGEGSSVGYSGNEAFIPSFPIKPQGAFSNNETRPLPILLFPLPVALDLTLAWAGMSSLG
jgi:hypothetical protein